MNQIRRLWLAIRGRDPGANSEVWHGRAGRTCVSGQKGVP